MGISGFTGGAPVSVGISIFTGGAPVSVGISRFTGGACQQAWKKGPNLTFFICKTRSKFQISMPPSFF